MDQIFYADQGLGNQQQQNHDMRSEMNLSDAELKFMHFIQEQQEQNVFIYR